ncbi:site-specific integrase [Nostoc sp. XA010]|uniref:site-specific integrase n=1 Tax=Nostoc sp. XA010 TaxID=2780407 RepID=UPI001E5AB9F4|nr:site-specific integrase [Nostoc sp. XA010]MCC5658646.1 site-specific integrase [Nostoc sp. XA010]
MNSSEHTVHILGLAEAIATQIEKDIQAGHFDPILKSYCLPHKTDPSKPKTLLELWDLWVASLDLPEETKANHYKWVRQMIAKTNPGLTNTDWLTKSEISPRTYKDRLSFIRSCCRWGLANGLIETNPYENIKLRKAATQEIKPFSLDELKAIIDGFDELYPHYSGFIRFLAITGARPSEVIGLTWGCIDLTKPEVVIKESLSRDPLGNGYTRTRKGTKTGNIRYLTLPNELIPHFGSPKATNELVFSTPEGKPIDDSNFRDRYWKQVLKHKNIPYRKPYTLRHTMASHGIEQGIPITGMAYLLGHRDTTMVMRTYGHMVNRPDLPELPIG